MYLSETAVTPRKTEQSKAQDYYIKQSILSPIKGLS